MFVLDPPNSDLRNVHIHDLAISGLSGGSKTGRNAIRYVSGSTKKLSNLQLNRLLIADMNGDGISLVGASDSHVAGFNAFELEVRNCAGHGLTLHQGYQACLMRARFAGNGGSGLYATDSGVTLYVCAFDANAADTQAYFKECYLGRVEACTFRNFGLRGAQLVECGGTGPVGGCLFIRNSYSATSIGIEVGSNSPASVRDGAFLFLPNTFSGVGTAVYLNNTALGCIVLPQTIIPIGVGSTTPVRYPAGTNADNASTFALPSTGGPTHRPSGLLIPSFTADPAADNQAGMLYFEVSSTNALRTFLPGSPAAWHGVLLTEKPPAVTDLSIQSTVGRTTLVVNWTAPPDLGWPGGVEEYKIRYSTAPITEANFDSAMVPTGTPPTPSPPDTQECFKVSGSPPLSVCTTYYVAVKSKLAGSGGWSGISNVPSRKTKCSGTGEVDCPS